MRVGRKNDDSELGMREYGSAVVKQEVAAEFCSGAGYPAEGAEVVVDGVGDQEGVGWVQGLGRGGWKGGVGGEEVQEVAG